MQQHWRGRAGKELVVAQLGGADSALRQHLVGDIPAHAPVAAELPVRIEDRLSTHADESRSAIDVGAAHDELPERPASLQVGTVRGPLLGRELELGDLPAGAADLAVGHLALVVGQPIGDPGEAQLRVLLPVPVGSDVQQPLEALLSVSHRL